MINRLDIDDRDFDARLTRLLAWEPEHDQAIEQSVKAIIADVRRRGDPALLDYTRRFDRLDCTEAAQLRLQPAELRAALQSLSHDQRRALETAADRIRRYHFHQKGDSWSYVEADGTRLGQRVLPIDRVGLYVPGGKAAYPSSVLMNAIPARVAGVRELAMVVPTPDGIRNPMVLAAACIASVDEVYTIGGAHAVAALAFGTGSIRAVDKIVGPGNAYVALAKREVFGTVGIDMIAGPSEILVVSDGSVPADWVAMDLFSQAEHDEMAQAILISDDAAFLDAVAASIARQIGQMPRQAVITQSLKDRGALIRVNNLAQAAELVNRVAPEHLELAVKDAQPLLQRIRHAGAIFVGRYSSESLGDYCAGPSHVLPTMRTPRFSSPLGVPDFEKRSSLIEVSRAGAQALGRLSAVLARGEGLEAHARSAEYRLEEPPAAGASNAGVAAPADAPADAAAFADRLVRPDVLRMSSYHVPDASGLLKLDAMENPYELPVALREALSRRLSEAALNRYPVPIYGGLKDAIRRSFKVPPWAGLVLGNGSDELISMLVTLLNQPGATVLAPVPTFVMYAMSSQFARMKFVGVDLDPDFRLDLPAMLAAIDLHQPALVFIAYPNNPTGNSFSREAIEQIVRRAPGLVVLDEAYEPFAPDSWLPRLAEFPNLAVMRTLSKLGLAGARLGYLAAAPAWTEQLDKVRPPYNVSVLNEAAVEFALGHAQVFAEQARAVREARDLLAGELRSLVGQGLDTVFDSQANFILIRVATQSTGGLAAGADVARRMRESGVLIKDVGKMHPMLDNCLRLTVGAPDENKRMLAALRQALAGQA
jgi:histidinol dehydrogenase